MSSRDSNQISLSGGNNCSGLAASSGPRFQKLFLLTRDNRKTFVYVQKQTISVCAHAVICSVGLEAVEALSIAGLDWPPLVAKLFEEGGTSKQTLSSEW